MITNNTDVYSMYDNNKTITQQNNNVRIGKNIQSYIEKMDNYEKRMDKIIDDYIESYFRHETIKRYVSLYNKNDSSSIKTNIPNNVLSSYKQIKDNKLREMQNMRTSIANLHNSMTTDIEQIDGVFTKITTFNKKLNEKRNELSNNITTLNGVAGATMERSKEMDMLNNGAILQTIIYVFMIFIIIYLMTKIIYSNPQIIQNMIFTITDKTNDSLINSLKFINEFNNRINTDSKDINEKERLELLQKGKDELEKKRDEGKFDEPELNEENVKKIRERLIQENKQKQMKRIQERKDKMKISTKPNKIKELNTLYEKLTTETLETEKNKIKKEITDKQKEITEIIDLEITKLILEKDKAKNEKTIENLKADKKSIEKVYNNYTEFIQGIDNTQILGVISP